MRYWLFSRPQPGCSVENVYAVLWIVKVDFYLQKKVLCVRIWTSAHSVSGLSQRCQVRALVMRPITVSYFTKVSDSNPLHFGDITSTTGWKYCLLIPRDWLSGFRAERTIVRCSIMNMFKVFHSSIRCYPSHRADPDPAASWRTSARSQHLSIYS